MPSSLSVAMRETTKWRSGLAFHSSLTMEGDSTSPGLWMRGTVTSTVP